MATLCGHPAQLNHPASCVEDHGSWDHQLNVLFLQKHYIGKPASNNLALNSASSVLNHFQNPPLNLLSQGLPASLYQNPHQTKVEALVIRILEEGIFVYIQTPASPLFDSPSSRIILFLPDPEVRRSVIKNEGFLSLHMISLLYYP